MTTPTKDSTEKTAKTSRPDVKRITADFSPEAYEVLERVAKNLDTTKADALRRALGLLDFVLTERKEGWKVVLEKDDRRREIVTL
ncbi:hypothetical protein [Methylovulum psychrotolerans]|nr:hypothetical protein [Methylovulum psychrotolerans]